MFALLDFIVRLVFDVQRLISIFVSDVILGVGDPLSVVSFLVGQAFIVGAVLVLGYAAVGALLNEIGIPFPSLGGRGRVD